MATKTFCDSCGDEITSTDMNNHSEGLHDALENHFRLLEAQTRDLTEQVFQLQRALAEMAVRTRKWFVMLLATLLGIPFGWLVVRFPEEVAVVVGFAMFVVGVAGVVATIGDAILGIRRRKQST